MHFPRLSALLPPYGKRYDHRHEFLVFAVPEEKYGHHTALVWHQPKRTYRKVVATFGRMEKEIVNAELLGEIRMPRPYAWDELEDASAAGMEHYSKKEAGQGLFDRLKKLTEESKGIPVAVYLVKVRTNRDDLLFDGQNATLPSGYLTKISFEQVLHWEGTVAAAPVRLEELRRTEDRANIGIAQAVRRPDVSVVLMSRTARSSMGVNHSSTARARPLLPIVPWQQIVMWDEDEAVEEGLAMLPGEYYHLGNVRLMQSKDG
ncbi:hypothetical protein C8R47DRAFT_1071001 [Mycena vitilis]|nr:hypothetical protein C8R47DRAFT_1071001 [Mycena vitilis]